MRNDLRSDGWPFIEKLPFIMGFANFWTNSLTYAFGDPQQCHDFS
jgi:hypothetical protein